MVLIQCLLGDRGGRRKHAKSSGSSSDHEPPGRDALKAWFDGSTSRSIEK